MLEELLLFSVYNFKLIHFGFWTVSAEIKQDF